MTAFFDTINNMGITVPSTPYIRREGGLSDNQLISRFRSGMMMIAARSRSVKIRPAEPQVRVLPEDGKLQWLMDTGADFHVRMNRDFFTDYVALGKDAFTWSTSGGVEGEALGDGKVTITMIRDDGLLHDIEFLAYYAPKIYSNIISACTLRRDLRIYYSDRDLPCIKWIRMIVVGAQMISDRFQLKHWQAVNLGKIYMLQISVSSESCARLCCFNTTSRYYTSIYRDSHTNNCFQYPGSTSTSSIRSNIF